MVTCPNCNHQFKLTFRKKTFEERKSLRFAKAWKHVEEIVKDYEEGYAILWLCKKYSSSKKIIRDVLKENGIKDFRGRKGIQAWNKGLNHFTDERILKWSGSKNVNWKGGVSELRIKIRRCAKYKAWVRMVFERDNHTCQMCYKRGGDIEADHYPISFHKLMENIKTFKEAIYNDKLWDIKNGRTLCIKCHKKTF